MAHKLAIIGLGAVGRRFLDLMSAHPRFEVARAWDRDGVACAAAREACPGLVVAESAEAAIGAAEVDAVYVAVPPFGHRELVLATLAAGKGVFCEKPLGIDLAESRELVATVEASGVPAAVNFVYGSAPAGLAIQEKLNAGALGGIAGVDIRLHFPEWPRAFQGHAGWLAERAQGGFVREVLSHFVYFIERVFGPAKLVQGGVRYPEGSETASETHALARFDCAAPDGAALPVTFAGSVGGLGPALVECTVWGSERSCRLVDFYRLFESAGGPWRETPRVEVSGGGAEPGPEAYRAQLDNLAALLDGEPHSMPDFRAALSVQALIEDLLGRPGR